MFNCYLISSQSIFKSDVYSKIDFTIFFETAFSYTRVSRSETLCLTNAKILFYSYHRIVHYHQYTHYATNIHILYIVPHVYELYNHWSGFKSIIYMIFIVKSKLILFCFFGNILCTMLSWNKLCIIQKTNSLLRHGLLRSTIYDLWNVSDKITTIFLFIENV